jgi:protein-S-isoprenylcysteine O-methyltransferase Ste14
MDESIKFRVALGILTAAVLIIRTPRQARSFDSGEKQRLEGRLNVAVRSLAGLMGIALLVVYLVKPAWMAWAALPVPDWMRWLGAALGGAGVAGLMWVHRELGRNFSATLQVRPDQTLVTSGPYRWVRHPMYTTLYLIVLSFFLISANWLIGTVWLGSFTAVVVTRVSKEDAAMEAKFSDAYRAWAAHTGGLVPRLW